MPSSLKTPGLSHKPLSSSKESDSHSLATLKLLAHLVEETSDILTAADIQFRPITWNKASEKIYGLKAEEVIGRDLRDFIFVHYQGCDREAVRAKLASQGEWRGEAWFVRPCDQKTITLLISFKQLKDDKEGLLGYLVSATDITERKEAESRLRESEQRFRDMADLSPAMIWLSDEDDITIYKNKKLTEFTGEEVTNDTEGWAKIIHPDDKKRVTTEYINAFDQKKQVTIVYRLRRADGSYCWVHDTSVPRFLSNGKFVGYLGSIVDIEDEKQRQEQLLYQVTILENVSDIVVTTDLDYKIKIWNKIAEDLYGISQSEAIGQHIGDLLKFQFYNTTSKEALNDLHQNSIWKGEVSIVNRRGEIKHFLHTVKYIYNDNGEKTGYLAVGRDITEKKIADEKLKESELFYRTLIADSMDGMILLNKEGRITFASPSVKNVLDYTVEDIVGRNGFEFVHPDDLTWAFDSFQREVDQNTEIKFITIRLLKKDGQWLWCTVRGHNLLDNPHVNSVVIYFHDDTLRKQAKDALQESETRFRSLIRDLQIGVFLSDREGNIIMCNKALCQMLSIPEEIVVGKNVYDIMSTDMINEKNEFIPVAERPLTLTLQSKQKIKDAVLGVLHPVSKERSWIMVNSDPILDDQGDIKHVVCSVMNLTERKKLERQLVADQVAHQRQLTQATIDGQENERREIGKELHDNIGQQLTTVKLFLDFIKSSADDATNEMVSMALKGVSDLINDVRAMSRSLVPFTLKDLGLTESINELIDSLRRTKVLNIEFDHIDFAEEILAENQKLAVFRIVQEQLNNIVRHASAENVFIRIAAIGKEMQLEIRDDGNGFDSNKIRKGLGFINIKNRVELFNGKAEVFSKPGQGCFLKICFPLIYPAPEE
jgi:PAS domain S-box-containing protein